MNQEPSFAIRYGWLGESRLITLAGDIDLAATTALDSAVSIIPPFHTAYVDCSAVDFMDSRGLQALTEINERLCARHSALRLIELSEPTARIMRLCRLNAGLRRSVTGQTTSASRSSYCTHTSVRGRSHRGRL